MVVTSFDDARSKSAGWPYAAAPEADLESIRRNHIRAEVNLQTVGTLAVISGVLTFISLGVALVMGLASPHGSAHTLGPELVVLIASAVCYLTAGRWLRGFERRGRSLLTGLLAVGLGWQIASAISLAGAGLGAVAYVPILMSAAISGLFLAAMWNTKASTVMTPHYQQVVIPATPMVRYKSRLLWFLLPLLLFAFCGVAMAAG